MTKVYLRDLERMEYGQAWDLQESLMKEGVDLKMNASDSEIPAVKNHLLLCQHPHVYTLGKHGKRDHLIISEKDCENKGISFYQTNRGGDITYHGPGQLVAYPILDLEQFKPDLKGYIYLLEETVIGLLKEFGIESGRLNGHAGVWLDAGVPGKERKICAIGVKSTKWITMHGLALNMNTDLEYFDYIIPCGITGKAVTGMNKELGSPVDEKEVYRKFTENFSRVFEVEII